MWMYNFYRLNENHLAVNHSFSSRARLTTEKLLAWRHVKIIALFCVLGKSLDLCRHIFFSSSLFSFAIFFSVFLQSCGGKEGGRQCSLQGERLQKSIGLLHASYRALPGQCGLLWQPSCLSHDDGFIPRRLGRCPWEYTPGFRLR